MNILFWCLPFAMVSGALDVMLPEREKEVDSEWPAAAAERTKRADDRVGARSAS
jgi:hypothetical protein